MPAEEDIFLKYAIKEVPSRQFGDRTADTVKATNDGWCRPASVIFVAAGVAIRSPLAEDGSLL